MNNDFNKLMQAYLQLALDPGFPSYFGGLVEPKEPPFESLKCGYELRPIELTPEESKNSRIVNLKYSHQYFNGELVSDHIFRKGGMGGEFKDGYCELIHYVRTDDGFSSGVFVVINKNGQIVLNGNSYSDHSYHIVGHIGKLKDLYYDLRTSEPIMIKGSDEFVGKNSVIVNHNYDWYGKKEGFTIPLGIYKIDGETCELTKIDDVK